MSATMLLSAAMQKKEKMQQNLSQGLAIGSELAPMIIGGSPNEFGVDSKAVTKSTISNAMRLASAGASFGPWGAAAGAVVGGIIGYSEGDKEQRAAKRLEKETKLATDRMVKSSQSNSYKAFVAGNPNFEKGSLTSAYYMYGGLKKKAMGGSMEKAPGGSVEFKGPSHEQGGINIGNGIEVEGNETMDNGFVFSDRLGFAAKHKKLTNKLKLFDLKPASKATANSINATHSAIEDLKVAQEALKSAVGMPNDLDGTSGMVLTKKAFGGEIFEDGAPYKPNSMKGIVDLSSTEMQPIPSITPSIELKTEPILASKALLNTVDPKLSQSFDNNIPADEIEKMLGKSNTGGKLVEAFTKAAPYLSNIANAAEIKRMPMPAEPKLIEPIQSPTVDYSQSIEAAKQENILSTKMAEKYLTSGAGIAAAVATSGSQRVNNVAKIVEAEQNANAQLAGQTNQLNTYIKGQNNALVNSFLQDRVSRVLKQAELRSENRSNAAEKFMVQMKDLASNNADKDKLLIALSSDVEGVAWRQLQPFITEKFGKGSTEYKYLKDLYETRESRRRKAAEETAKTAAGTSANKPLATDAKPSTETVPTVADKSEVKTEQKSEEKTSGSKDKVKSKIKAGNGTKSPLATTAIASAKKSENKPASTPAKQSSKTTETKPSVLTKQATQSSSYAPKPVPATKKASPAPAPGNAKKLAAEVAKINNNKYSVEEQKAAAAYVKANYSKEHNVSKQVKQYIDNLLKPTPNVGGVSGLNIRPKNKK